MRQFVTVVSDEALFLDRHGQHRKERKSVSGLTQSQVAHPVSAHCYFIRLNPRKMETFKFCLPAIHTQDLKTKRIQRGILEIIQFIHMEKHLDGPCDTFVKRNHSMALSQYIKRRHLVQTIFKFHREVKKCHFGNFSERAGMAVSCQYGPQESLTGYQNFFCLGFR